MFLLANFNGYGFEYTLYSGIRMNIVGGRYVDLIVAIIRMELFAPADYRNVDQTYGNME